MIFTLSTWWLATGVLFGAPAATHDPGAGTGAGERHEFHVTYARLGIEGDVVQVRLRFFADDLVEGLRRAGGDPGSGLAVDPRVDSLVTAYVNARFVVTAGTARLSGGIVASGEEAEGQEPVWWYVFAYRAPVPVRTLTLRNTLLTELFDDQRNIVRVQHFPSEKQQTWYLTVDDPEARFDV